MNDLPDQRRSVEGRIKLHAHGLIERHMDLLQGDPMRRFLDSLTDACSNGTGCGLHFATATRHLLRLGAAGGRPQSVLPYLCALWVPGVLRSRLARAWRAVGAPGQGVGAP